MDEEVAESWEEAADSGYLERSEGVLLAPTLKLPRNIDVGISNHRELTAPEKGKVLGMLQLEMEKRLEEKLRISQRESHNSPRSPLKTAMVIQDESLPAAPPPQIRILKRPANNGSLASPLNQNKPTPQVKSLAQREAEYAEARKRILGSACPEEVPQDKPSTDRPGRNNSTQPSEDARSANHTVRQPAGPDGSHGFRQHR